MTEGIVFYMCEGKSPAEISCAYKKSVIVQMYLCLFTIDPPKRATALDLAYAIWNFIRDVERTADLCKNLH